MIAAIAACRASRAPRPMERFAAWETAIERLRRDAAGGALPPVTGLPRYLAAIPDDQRGEATLDLVAEHLRLTWRSGGRIGIEQYFQLPGTCGDVLHAHCALRELFMDELLARHERPYGDHPTLEEYRRRLVGHEDAWQAVSGRFIGDGRYVLLRHLGDGGMGCVWRGHDQYTGAEVAIKTCRGTVGDGGLIAQRLRRESAVLASLEHSGIVRVVGSAADGASEPFLVMPFLAGRRFDEVIRGHHQASAGEGGSERRRGMRALLETLAGVCEAVGHAHRRGVVHRDLKPGNVMVLEDGQGVVIDWGLAGRRCELAANQELGAMAGTPDYMPPEQADGRADERSDVFGLGAMLYELLTGRPPYVWPEGDRPDDWPRAVRDARYPAPRQVNRRTSRRLEAICLRAMARRAEDRYSTAMGMSVAVRRCLLDGRIDDSWGTRATGALRRWWRGLGRGESECDRDGQI